MAPQQARTDSVERPHPEPGRLAFEQPPNAVAHLPGSLVREGDGEDLLWRHTTLMYQVYYAGGQNPGLTGARPGEHQYRSLEVRDGLSLFGIEGSQIDVFQEARVRLGRRQEVGLGRWLLRRACPVPLCARGGHALRCVGRERDQPPNPRSLVVAPGVKMRSRMSRPTPGPSSSIRTSIQRARPSCAPGS